MHTLEAEIADRLEAYRAGGPAALQDRIQRGPRPPEIAKLIEAAAGYPDRSLKAAALCKVKSLTIRQALKIQAAESPAAERVSTPDLIKAAAWVAKNR